MKLTNHIGFSLLSHCIATAVFLLSTLAIGNQSHAAELNEKPTSSDRDVQVLRSYDWVLLNTYDATGEETSNLLAAGSGSPKLSFLKEGTLVVERPCASISGDYKVAKNNELTFRGYSIAGSICAVGLSWQVERLTTALSQLQRFQVLPNQNKFKVRLLLYFGDGSQWTLAPTNKLLVLD